MSEKDNATFDSSEEDEFLKRNLPVKKICSQCKREYNDPNILFCYYDGNRLTLTETPNMVKSGYTQKAPQIFNEFSGFELNLQNAGHNLQIPLELIQSTIRLIQTNPKMPLDSENVKTWLWAIPSPKKKRNVFSKLINHVGFSRINLASYLVCYILILATYIMWVTEINPQIFNLDALYNPVILGLGLVSTLVTLFILIFPIISLGYTESEILQATRKDFFLRIEPTVFFMALILNYIIFRLGWPVPILIIPGEPKIKGSVPIEHIAKSIKRGILPTLVLGLGSFGVYLGMKLLKYNNSLIMINVELTALFGLTILLFELLPFGNFIGKILLKQKQMTFYFSFTVVVMSLMTIISLISI